VEVWQTSNLRRLRLGEEKKKERKKKKPQGKNIMSASATQGSHNKRQDGNIMACPIPQGGHKNTNNVIKFRYKK